MESLVDKVLFSVVVKEVTSSLLHREKCFSICPVSSLSDQRRIRKLTYPAIQCQLRWLKMVLLLKNQIFDGL